MGAAAQPHVRHVVSLLGPRIGGGYNVRNHSFFPTVPDMEPPPGYFNSGYEISKEEEEEEWPETPQWPGMQADIVASLAGPPALPLPPPPSVALIIDIKSN